MTHCFDSLSECFLEQPLFVVSIFSNNLSLWYSWLTFLCCFNILEWLVVMIFLIDISLLFQYSWMTCCYDILDWHLFAFSIVFVFWCLFSTTHIIMTFLNSIFNFSCLKLRESVEIRRLHREFSVLFWPSIRTCCVTWHCLVSSHKSHAVDADSAF